MEYVSGVSGHPEGCVLCAALADQADEHSLVVGADELAFLVLNKFPYAAGHLMAVPTRHVASLLEATADEQEALMTQIRTAMRLLDATFHPEGFNIGWNHGDAAGASLSHLHVHIVPRWIGDTNFMPVVGAVKVIPQDLDATAVRLRDAYPAAREGA